MSSNTRHLAEAAGSTHAVLRDLAAPSKITIKFTSKFTYASASASTAWFSPRYGDPPLAG